MARPISVIDLTPEETTILRRRASSPTVGQRDVRRARIVLLRAEGRREEDVATEVGISINTVSLWLSRFEEKGLEGLNDQPGRGRKPWLAPEKIRKVVTDHAAAASQFNDRALDCENIWRKRCGTLCNRTRTAVGEH